MTSFDLRSPDSTRSAVRALLLLIAATVLLLAGCKPPYPKCDKNEHCAERGEVCVQGLCRECESDAQCKPGFECVEFACVQQPECRLDSDCGEGQRCRGGQCVPECTSDRECAAGERCVDNRCVPEGACTTDADCARGERCVAGRCTAGEGAEAGLSAEEAERRRRLKDCRPETVFFGFNEFALGDDARDVLERNAECVRFQNRPVVIGGHADERGTEEYNLVLAQKRANSVARYMQTLGVPAALLSTVSYGEERPLDRASNEQAWSRNRRAEFTFR